MAGPAKASLAARYPTNTSLNGLRKRRSGDQSVIAKTTSLNDAPRCSSAVRKSRAVRKSIIAERATSPRSEDQRVVAVCVGDVQDTGDTVSEQIARAGLADVLCDLW